MNWIPVEIEPEWLNIEDIMDVMCEYMDADDFAENMLNEIYGNSKIGNFLIPTGTALRRIYEAENGDEWENIVDEILETEAEEIKFGLENDGSYHFLSYHFILIDEESAE